MPSIVEKLLEIGRVGKTHGLRGEVKVTPETDEPTRFEVLETVYLGTEPADAVPHTVASVRFQQRKHGLTVLLKLVGIDTQEEAAALRGHSVFALEDDLPPLADDEYFLHDLVGLRVLTDTDEVVGTVKDVLEMPMHPVLVVARPGKPDALIPAVAAFLVDIDLDGGQLVVQPIEGLLD